MDLLLHLNAKHYAICDAVFHILPSLSLPTPLSPSTLSSWSFPELPQTTITAEPLGSMLTKFPYHHIPLEIPIVKSFQILQACVRAQTHTHTQVHHTKQRFSSVGCDSTKNCPGEDGKRG